MRTGHQRERGETRALLPVETSAEGGETSAKGAGPLARNLNVIGENQLAAPTKAKRFLPALLNMVHYGSSSASFSSSKHTDWPGHVLKQYQGKKALDQIGPDRINLE